MAEYLMITIDEFGRSALSHARNHTGKYGKNLSAERVYTLEGSSGHSWQVRLRELFTHIHTGRGVGQSPYVYAEMEVVE